MNLPMVTGFTQLLELGRFTTSLGCDVAHVLVREPAGIRLHVTLSCRRRYIPTDHRPRKKRKP